MRKKNKKFKDKHPIPYQIYDKLGIRLIFEKLIPPIEKKNFRKPSSLIIWCVGIYISLYGLSVTNYKNCIDKIENQANIVVSQLGTNSYKNALMQIPYVQNRECPIEPLIYNPYSIFFSILGLENTNYSEIIEQLKGIVVIYKDSLSNLNLSKIKLINADMSFANLEKSILFLSDLSYINLGEANLIKANLSVANLFSANLHGANLDSASLSGANLSNTDLSSASLKNVDFDFANLDSADLRGAYSLCVNQLLNAKSLYNIKIDSILLEQIKKIKPELLKKHKWMEIYIKQ